MNAPDEATRRAHEELRHWGSEEALNPLDSLMWRTERPPGDSWTGVVLAVLGSSPSWDRMQASHRWALKLVPRFTERVVDPALPTGPPRWSPDPHFDLDHHLQHVVLDGPGSVQQVLELAEQLGVQPLDRDRPPWRAIYVEGLEDGGSAYLLQAHHVVMDGAAATQLFSRILDRAQDADPVAVEEPEPRPRVNRLKAAGRGLAWQGSAVPGIVSSVAGAATKAVADPLTAWNGAAAYARSLARVARPTPSAESGLLQPGPRTTWRFGTLECELADIKKAGKAVGGTVNDAFVSAILGGLRHYHAEHGAELGDVPISMPVSVRRDDDPMGGNRFTGAFFSAPSGVADPADRIRAMRERVAQVREEPALDFLNTVIPLMNLAPTPVVATAITALATSATLTTSCWPGVPFPTYLAGAPFERMFVFGPLPGTAMCAALCTHVDTCCIGINVDGDVFPDTDVLWTSLRKGLDEVLALG